VNRRRFAFVCVLASAVVVLAAVALWPASGGKSVDVATNADTAPSSDTTTTTDDITVDPDAITTTTFGPKRTTTTSKAQAKATTATTADEYCGTWGYSYPQAPNPNYPSGQISVSLGGSHVLTGHPVIFEMTYSSKAYGPATADPYVSTPSSGFQSFKARLSVGASAQGETFVVRARAKDASIVCTSHPLPAKYYPPESTAPPSTYPPATQPPETTTTSPDA